MRRPWVAGRVSEERVELVLDEMRRFLASLRMTTSFVVVELFWFSPSDPEEAVEGGGQEEGEQDFRDEVAGEEEDACGGEGGKAGVEGGAGVVGSCGPVET